MEFLWIALCISMAISAKNCEGNQLSHIINEKASKFLFGDLWQSNQYCGHNSSGPEKARDDYAYQGFYNGTNIDYIYNLKQPERIRRSLSELIHTGLAARNSISIICSVSSWGYADELSYHLSNSKKNNPTGCWSELTRILLSLKILSDHTLRGAGSSNQVSIMNGYLVRDLLQLNTFGRINQGYPFDSHIWLGDYDACKRLPGTRYCFGSLRQSEWPTTARPGGDGYIRVGMCLPEDCNSKSFSSSSHLIDVLDQILAGYQRGIQASLFDNGSTHLVDVYCLPEDRSEIRSYFRDTLSTVLVIASIFWMMVISYSTLCGLIKRREVTNSNIINSFDLVANYRRFFRNTSADTSGLTALNFIKVLGILWLMFSHNLQLIMPYLRNPQDLRIAANSSPIAMIILQAQHGVVVFFLISGFLAGHKYLRSEKELDFKKLVIARYARLAPLYLLIYALVKKFAHLMGSGPLWDYGVSPQSEIRQCMKESWLVPILMLANFIPPFVHCILTGWHIANDFQIYLLIPILLKIYQSSRKTGRFIALTSFAISHLFHYWNFHRADSFNFETLSREPFTIGTRTLMERLSFDYVNPVGRFGTYFLGVLLADVIQKTGGEIQSDNKLSIGMVTLNHRTNRSRLPAKDDEQKSAPTKASAGVKDDLLMTVAVGSLLVCLISPALPVSVKDIFHPYSKTLTYPSLRVLNEISWFYVLYYILKNRNRTVDKELITSSSETSSRPEPSSQVSLMELPVWNIAVKLNYTLVVIHFTIARYLIQSQTQLINFSWPNLIQIITFNALATYCVAFIVHLVIEIPLMSVIKKILILL